MIQEPQATDIEQIVRQAARKYGLNEEHFLSIAMCESTMNPSAINYGYYENGHPSGLFQHLSGYYPARAAKAGYSTDVFDAYSNANTTAAMWSQGLSYLWECS
ncbi:transglycosylase SLT domain-containing protein [Paeniglutamicibacter sp. ABSL32-1]|uniref:transglycosylase SLT domain-containing protein n=1 Tax=Paeniglutamicibacter quisquiliarum TaxID=2849498 RepID=UPI001C2D084A|nr:transglycosylase SLT domain-containing protein [Paeniglutamicibacter quisquiliarum]